MADYWNKKAIKIVCDLRQFRNNDFSGLSGYSVCINFSQNCSLTNSYKGIHKYFQTINAICLVPDAPGGGLTRKGCLALLSPQNIRKEKKALLYTTHYIHHILCTILLILIIPIVGLIIKVKI